MLERFYSTFKELGYIRLPEFSETRVLLMPVVLGDMASIPKFLDHYSDTIRALFDLQSYSGKTGYLTIDEREVKKGFTLRRPGLHVDGVYMQGAAIWGGGGGGAAWGGAKPKPKPDNPGGNVRQEPPGLEMGSGWGPGLLTISNPQGCRAWKKKFYGFPKGEGECDHLADQCDHGSSTILAANTVYWMDPLCVHESLPMEATTKRQFVRLSLPSTGPWYEGCTPNPLGVKPTGVTLPPRTEFLNHHLHQES